MRSRSGRPTLDAVAAAAGVSKATASKVLNDRDGVSEATRERVRGAMNQLRYVPVPGRRVGGSSPTITVLFDGNDSLYSAQVLTGIVLAGTENGVDVVVTSAPGPHRHEPLSAEWLRVLAEKGHEGVIVVTTAITPAAVHAAADVGLGLVAVDPVIVRDSGEEGLVSVSATNWTGGVQATDHLLGLGHRRIGYAGGPPASYPARQRLHGHVAALRAAGIDADPALVRQLGFSHDDGRVMATELLAVDAPPTAVVAGCDASALGVLAAARQRHLRVPDDLSVVGFDDTFAADMASPPLTTVRQPLREMGRLAMRTVLALARGEGPETHHFELATTLVVRESTAPPRR